MTEEQAIKRAQTIAKQRGEFVAVVYADDEDGYQPATEWAMDTHFATLPAIHMAGPDGELQQ